MTHDDALLCVSEFREEGAAPSRVCDLLSRIINLAERRGLPVAAVDITAAESASVAFSVPGRYADIEVDWDGRIEAVTPGKIGDMPEVFPVADSDEMLGIALDIIADRLRAPKKAE